MLIIKSLKPNKTVINSFVSDIKLKAMFEHIFPVNCLSLRETIKI